MSITINATYERGVLKPKELLPLKEHQEVRLVVIEERAQTADESRVAEMAQQVEAWLATQPANTAREPEPMSAVERARLDKELEDLLADLRGQSTRFDEEEIAADVDVAVSAARLA